MWTTPVNMAAYQDIGLHNMLCIYTHLVSSLSRCSQDITVTNRTGYSYAYLVSNYFNPLALLRGIWLVSPPG